MTATEIERPFIEADDGLDYPEPVCITNTPEKKGMVKRVLKYAGATVLAATSIIAYENRELIHAGLAYWRSDKDPAPGDIYLEYNECKGEAPSLVAAGPEGVRIETGYYPEYEELDDNKFQQIRDNGSAATARPSVRPTGYEETETMFGPFGSYFDRNVGEIELSFGARLKVMGSSQDMSFRIDQHALESMISDMFNMTELYEHPYIREFVKCRHDSIMNGDYAGKDTGLYIIPDRFKGLDGNNVVTFKEGRKPHSYGLGIAGVEASIFGFNVLEDGLIIVPGSARPGNEESTLHAQLTKRLIEEVSQWLLSGDNIVDIAREYVKLERNVDYVAEELWEYYESSGKIPEIIILEEKGL